MPIRRQRLRLTVFLLSLAGPACNGDDVSEPTTGSLEVTSVTSGIGADPDGYSVMFDGRAVGSIGVTGSALIADLPPGEHQVDLGGLAANCQIAGESPRAVTIVEGQPASVAFTIDCGEAVPPTNGELEVTVTTGGTSIDGDGYSVALYNVVGPPIAANGSVSISGLTPGEQAVALVNVAQNCAVQGEHPVRLTLEGGVPATVAFTVLCRTPIRAPWPIVGSGTHDLRHVSGTSSSNVFVMGHSRPCETCHGEMSILHYDGAGWATQLTALGSSLDVWAASSGVAFALVEGPSPSPFLRYNGADWTSVPADQIEFGDGGGGLFALWGSSPIDVYAVGVALDAGLARHPYAAHFDESGWLPVDLPPVDGLSLTDVWGSAQTDVYAVGTAASVGGPSSRGVVLHFDGAGWSTVFDEPHLGLGRVWGTGPSDVWVTGQALVPTGDGRQEVGGHGAIRHFDGTSWSTVQSPTSATLGAVWARSSAEVYVLADGGQSGSAWRYDGTTWIELALGAGNPYDIWGSPTGDVFVVGTGGVILRGP
jgi:hypothetical protein